jgi:DNA-binding response OmpR family regulator
VRAQAERIAELEEQIAQFKDVTTLRRTNADGGPSDDMVGALCLRLRLTPAQAKIVAALYQSRGVVSNRALFDVATTRAATLKPIDTHICKLRKVLGFSSIETVHGFGYRLSDECRGRLNELFAKGRLIA